MTFTFPHGTAAVVPAADGGRVLVFPPGCDQLSCVAHYGPAGPPGPYGCIFPSWFNGGGWHLTARNPDCPGHRMESP